MANSFYDDYQQRQAQTAPNVSGDFSDTFRQYTTPQTAQASPTGLEGKSGVRSYLEGKGAQGINWNADNNAIEATINGKKMLFDTSGFDNVDGHLYGTDLQLNNMYNSAKTGLRDYAQGKGATVGWNPEQGAIINGQITDTTGLNLVNGTYYGNQNQLADIVNPLLVEKYNDSYADKKNDLLDQMLNYKDYSFDPENDPILQSSMEYARRAAIRDAQNRGRGDSFGMNYAAAAAANQLIPQYEEKAYNRYLNDRNYLGELMNSSRGLSDDELNRYMANRQLDLNERTADQNYEATLNQLTEQKRANAVNEALQSRSLDQTDKAQEYEMYKFREEIKENQRQFDAQMALNWAAQNLDVAKFERSASDQDIANALNMWTVSGYASPQVARVLGVAEGTPSAELTSFLMQNALQQEKFAYQQQKDAKKASENDSGDDGGGTNNNNDALSEIINGGKSYEWQ